MSARLPDSRVKIFEEGYPPPFPGSASAYMDTLNDWFEESEARSAS
jgi:hypothetical protein